MIELKLDPRGKDSSDRRRSVWLHEGHLHTLNPRPIGNCARADSCYGLRSLRMGLSRR